MICWGWRLTVRDVHDDFGNSNRKCYDICNQRKRKGENEILYNIFLWSETCLEKAFLIKPGIIVEVLSAEIKVFKVGSNAIQIDSRMLTSALRRRFPKHLAALQSSCLGQVDLLLLETVRFVEDEEGWLLRLIQQTLSWGIQAFEVAVKASRQQKSTMENGIYFSSTRQAGAKMSDSLS